MVETTNILSIDVESWVHFYNDALRLPQSTQGENKQKLDNGFVPLSVQRMLTLLETYRQRATFFIIAELYDWYPDVITAIAEAGHEIGYHTHDHTIIHSKEILSEQLLRSSSFLRQFQPKGFRAPQIHIDCSALGLLQQYGFQYSSSTYAPHHKHHLEGVDEIPVSTLSFRGSKPIEITLPQSLNITLLTRQIPFGSGLFLAFGNSPVKWCIERVNTKGVPAVLFLHPWQLLQPSEIHGIGFTLRVLKRNPFCLPYLRNVNNIFVNLLKNYSFTSFAHYYGY